MPPPLHHLRLPAGTPYTKASHFQSLLFNLHLLHKRTPLPTPPPPYLLTSSFTPTYTLGRRQTLEEPPKSLDALARSGDARVIYTPRGGQITFHGPGQLVAYPIIDLKAHGQTPKCYIRLLEDSIIEVLGLYGVKGMTTADPGVWVVPKESKNGEEEEKRRKIASVGVNLRRWVSSHGFALNVDVEKKWWESIVACGLEGVEVVNLNQILREQGEKDEKLPSVEEVEEEAVKALERRLGCDGVREVSEEEVEETAKKAGVILQRGDDGVEDVTLEIGQVRFFGREMLVDITRQMRKEEKSKEGQEVKQRSSVL